MFLTYEYLYFPADLKNNALNDSLSATNSHFFPKIE